MAPPFLPGTSINPNPAHHHPRTTRFDIMQGQRLSDPLSHKLVPAPKHTNLFVWNQETGESRSQHDLHPKLHNMDVTMGRIPSWITYDGKVLRFTAYFRQAIQESQIETHRICPVAILFYLQDGTIRITETREDNNGMQHGAILQRHRMPLSETGYAYDGDHQFLSPEHIRIRRDLTLYSRVYRVVDCDQFTRQFYLDHLNVDLEPAEPIPDDPFHLKIKAAAAAVEAGRGHDHVSAHYESVHGKQQRWQLSKCRRFLEQDGKVLRFWAVWKHAHHSSEDRHLVVHFFLADDTCEVLEIAQPNSGRDPFPSLVKRQRLGKRAVGYGIDNIGEDVAIQTTSQRDQFYTAVDFQVGNVIRVFGRDVLLLRADPFTKQYYLDTFGIELHDMVDDARENERDKRPPEPESDHVEHEDEIVTSAIKAAKSARGKIPRSVEKQLSKSVMRFKARQVSVRPEDIAREFVISFFPLDDTVSVFENPIRNSGFLAGKFLERCIVYNRDQKRIFKKCDFKIGARIEIHSFIFELIEADSQTHDLLEGHAPKARTKFADVRSVVLGLRGLLKNKNTALRKTFRTFDNDKDGYLSRAEFENLLDVYGWDLETRQIDQIFNGYDRDQDGFISFDEFSAEVDVCGNTR